MKEIYVIRHAPKTADGGLTDHGKLLAGLLGSMLPEFTVIVSSQSPRAVETASLITEETPQTDDRAGFYMAPQNKSDAINKLAQERGIPFLEAVAAYGDAEVVDGVQAQAVGLNALIDDMFARLGDGEAGLIVSHDMTIAPAMALRGEAQEPIDYLTGYRIEDDGAVSRFDAQPHL